MRKQPFFFMFKEMKDKLVYSLKEHKSINTDQADLKKHEA